MLINYWGHPICTRCRPTLTNHSPSGGRHVLAYCASSAVVASELLQHASRLHMRMKGERSEHVAVSRKTGSQKQGFVQKFGRWWAQPEPAAQSSAACQLKPPAAPAQALGSHIGGGARLLPRDILLERHRPRVWLGQGLRSAPHHQHKATAPARGSPAQGASQAL
jgi:hypothetical protein